MTLFVRHCLTSVSYVYIYNRFITDLYFVSTKYHFRCILSLCLNKRLVIFIVLCFFAIILFYGIFRCEFIHNVLCACNLICFTLYFCLYLTVCQIMFHQCKQFKNAEENAKCITFYRNYVVFKMISMKRANQTLINHHFRL